MASNKPIVPKEEIYDFRLPPDRMYSRHVGDSVASSSGSNIRTFFIDMGFLPSLVDKVIEENGEDDVESLLNTLTTVSAEQKSIPESSDSFDGLRSGKKGSNHPHFSTICHKQAVRPLRTSKSESSDSLDSLFDDKDAPNEISSAVIPKEEADDYYDINDTNKASLLMMNFTVDEVNFAIDKLGGDAPINELVDFIIAAQIAVNLEKETDDDTLCRNELKKEATNSSGNHPVATGSQLPIRNSPRMSTDRGVSDVQTTDELPIAPPRLSEFPVADYGVSSSVELAFPINEAAPLRISSFTFFRNTTAPPVYTQGVATGPVSYSVRQGEQNLSDFVLGSFDQRDGDFSGNHLEQRSRPRPSHLPAISQPATSAPSATMATRFPAGCSSVHYSDDVRHRLAFLHQQISDTMLGPISQPSTGPENPVNSLSILPNANYLTGSVGNSA